LIQENWKYLNRSNLLPCTEVGLLSADAAFDGTDLRRLAAHGCRPCPPTQQRGPSRIENSSQHDGPMNPQLYRSVRLNIRPLHSSKKKYAPSICKRSVVLAAAAWQRTWLQHLLRARRVAINPACCRSSIYCILIALRLVTSALCSAHAAATELATARPLSCNCMVPRRP
jgi:hypothetical protein